MCNTYHSHFQRCHSLIKLATLSFPLFPSSNPTLPENKTRCLFSKTGHYFTDKMSRSKWSQETTRCCIQRVMANIYFYLLLSVKKKSVFIDSITDTTDGGSVSEKMIMCETHSCQLSTDGAGDCRRHGD